MEDQKYMTEIMSHDKMRKFVKWFDKEIGTENESENFGHEDEWSVTCFDLNMSEVEQCRKWENDNE